MQNSCNKIISVLLILCLAAPLFAYHRKNFLSRGPSVAAFGRGETSAGIFEDTSSSFYNPSLLAKLNMKNAAVAYYPLLEGSSYNFASFGLPIGSVYRTAVSLIDLRSGDVEIRKTITDNPRTINTNQWAYLLTLARPFENFYGINAGLSLRGVYFDMNGYTGSGLGADGGVSKDFRGPVLFGNKSSICTGFSVQNLVSPSVTLRSEAETYPQVFRLGGSISVPTLYRALSYDEITLASDLILEDNYLITLIGFEYHFMKQFIFRTGYYQDRFTIGAGYHLNNFHFDYGIDLGDYSEIHRFGISWFFASSSKDPLLKEAKESLAEANKAKKKRQKEAKILLKQAIAFYDKKYYLKATDLFKEIMINFPEYETPFIYMSKISGEIDQTISNNDSDIEKLSYANGYQNYQNRKYPEAINEWDKILMINPDRNELKEYLDKTKAYLSDADRIRKEKELLDKAKNLFDEGVNSYDNSKWVSCIKSMESVKLLCKDNKFPESLDYNTRASEYIKKCVTKLSAAVKPAESPKEEAVDIDIDEEGAERSYQDGLVLYAQGKLFDAEKAWELALRLDPNHAKAQKALKKLSENK